MARTVRGLPGVYNASAITLADGEGAALALNASGQLVMGGGVTSGAADTGGSLKIGGVYNTTPPTLDNGDRGDLQMDVSGNTLVSLATKIAGEDLTNDIMKMVQGPVSYSNQATSAAIKSGAGKFFGWMVNSHSTGTLKFWDNTTATAPILLNTITFASGPSQWTFPFGVTFATGLYATISGTIDYTVFYI